MTATLTRRQVLLSGVAATAAVGLGAVGAAASDQPSTSPVPWSRRSGCTAYTGATVIAVDHGRAHPGQTVLVRGETITAVGRFDPPVDADVVDLRGRYLVPGLSEMHGHSYFEQIDPALYVVNGVTTVREMVGKPEFYRWRERIDSGELLGPRFVIASPLIDGSPSLWGEGLLPTIEVTTAAEARVAVRRVQAGGADFVKVYSRVPRAALRAIATEARHRGIPFVGHCPDAVPMAEAARLGQRSFEHLHWTFFATSADEDLLRRRIEDIEIDQSDYNAWWNQMHPIEWDAAHSYDASKASALFDLFAERGARQVPTLTYHRGIDHARTLSEQDRSDPRRRFVPETIQQMWDGLVFPEYYLKGRTPELDAEWEAMFELQLELVGAMHRAGVPIMVGTDTGGAPAQYTGFTVHEELALLVQAGLSPADALRAATVEPAAFLGTQDTEGSIAPGKVADLVVLDADPLADIRHTQQIDAVVVRGRHIDRAERQRMLDEVERAAATMSEAEVTGAAAGCACHGPLRPGRPSV